MSDRLDERVAVITGGASGIGWAGAQRFVEEGASVLIADTDDAAGERAATTLGSDHAAFVSCDVTEDADVEKALDTALERWGRLDVVWNNAGVELVGPTALVEDVDYREVFDVNVLGVLHGCKHALSRLGDGGAILNTASVAGLAGLPNQVLYASSKAAVVSITRTVALEGSSRHIRCNCLCPAIVETPMIEKALGGPMTPEIRGHLASTTPFGRLLDADEIAAAATYLASSDASFITGQALTLDGGMMAGPLPSEPRVT